MQSSTAPIAPPVPVVVLAFHPVLARVDHIVGLEVEIVAAGGDRLFIGGLKAAGGWLDQRGYRYVLGSNARWAA